MFSSALPFDQDQYGEHPDERKVKNEEVGEKLESVETLTAIFGSLKKTVGKEEAITPIPKTNKKHIHFPVSRTRRWRPSASR